MNSGTISGNTVQNQKLTGVANLTYVGGIVGYNINIVTNNAASNNNIFGISNLGNIIGFNARTAKNLISNNTSSNNRINGNISSVLVGVQQ